MPSTEAAPSGVVAGLAAGRSTLAGLPPAGVLAAVLLAAVLPVLTGGLPADALLTVLLAGALPDEGSVLAGGLPADVFLTMLPVGLVPAALPVPAGVSSAVVSTRAGLLPAGIPA